MAATSSLSGKLLETALENGPFPRNKISPSHSFNDGTSSCVGSPFPLLETTSTPLARALPLLPLLLLGADGSGVVEGGRTHDTSKFFRHSDS